MLWRKEMIEKLGLPGEGEEEISLESVRKQPFIAQKETLNCEDVPWIILEKLMRMDTSYRDVFTQKGMGMAIQDAQGTAEFDKQLRKQLLDELKPFHGRDVFISIFQSCSMLLKQMLVKKLAHCRHSLPFIIPSESGSLQLSLWPLRSIVVEWQGSHQQSKEVSLVKHPFKIVSFVRFGAISKSKSLTLNNMISKSIKDTFFHRECSGCRKMQSFTEGIVEMSYVMPSKMPSQNENVMYLNVRGDGGKLQQQCNILQSISSCIVCFTELTQLSETEVAQSLNAIKGTNILVLIWESKGDNEEELQLIQKSAVDLTKFHVVKAYDNIEFADCNYTDLADDISDRIASVDNSDVLSEPLLSLKDKFTDLNVSIDEDNWASFSAVKGDVENIIKEIKGVHSDKGASKDCLFPLQGNLLKEWTQQLKSKSRRVNKLKDEDDTNTEESLLEEKNAFESNMLALRNEQYHKAKNLHEVMQIFIDRNNKNTDENNTFFKYLQLEMDDLAREVMPALKSEYQSKRETRKSDHEAWKKLEVTIDSASLGLEHFIREMGQIFESMDMFKSRLSSKEQSIFKSLPDFAANYFLSGHPLELMDGDSGVVPIHWIRAVVQSLQKNVGDKKLFILSTVGVQSTGKSTFLNTMFGLELAVRAGRCTKGIYAQLLPVDKTKSSLEVDFVFVVDSEGLCGSAKENFEHDNEIATLVIGISDLAIVNNKGENVHQMKEMFGIAVHSFVRMKEFRRFCKNKCIFLHQNVTGAMAVDQLQQDRLTLKQDLDAMVKSAAKEENVDAAISEVNHILDFDPDEDVYYIPDLWEGVPPMAQVSSGYTNSTREIRSYIISQIKKLRFYSTPRDIMVRLEDLWNGVLSDDFLFSFKNNLSVKAYLNLEKKYFKIVRDSIESPMYDFVKNQVKVKIETCFEKEDIDNLHRVHLSELEGERSKYLDSGQEDLLKYFRECDDKDQLLPWKDKKMKTLEKDANEIKEKLIKYMENCKNCRLLELEMIQSTPVLIEKALRGVVSEEGSTKLNEEDLKQNVTKLFNEWKEKSLNVDLTSYGMNIQNEMESVLDSIFLSRKRTHSSQLKEEMDRNWTFKDNDDTNLDISITDMRNDYVAPKRMAVAEEVPFSPSVKSPMKDFLDQVVNQTNGSLGWARDRLSDMMARKEIFHPAIGHELIGYTLDKIDANNQSSFSFTQFILTAEFEAMIAVKIAKLIVYEFNKSGVATMDGRLSAFKDQLIHLSLCEAQNCEPEKVACDLVENAIKTKVIKDFWNDLPPTVIGIVYETIANNKNDLLLKVQKDLASESDFQEYMSFSDNPHTYSEKWLNKSINTIFSGNDLKSPIIAKKVVEKDILGRIKDAKNCIRNFMRDKKSSFVSSLNKNLGMYLSTIDMQFIKIFEKKIDVIQFEDKLDHLADRQNPRMEHFVVKEMQLVNVGSQEWQDMKVHKVVLDRIWGCNEQCPFCKAPCVHTLKNHLEDGVNHSCNQHWPGGLIGVGFKGTNKLSTRICGDMVGSSLLFECTACDKKCKKYGKCDVQNITASHRYKEYKEVLPCWDIDVDSTGQASKYWQWVMCTFSEELKSYKTTLTIDLQIPESWKTITKEDAIASLTK